MNYYQMSFNNLEGFDSGQIHKLVTSQLGAGDWWHYLPSCYIFASAATSYSLANKIISAFPGLNFIITKIDINDYNGYLDKRAWEWLVDKAKETGVKYVPHASSPLVRILSGKSLVSSDPNARLEVLKRALERLSEKNR
jgi:hypothetical protein